MATVSPCALRIRREFRELVAAGGRDLGTRDPDQRLRVLEARVGGDPVRVTIDVTRYPFERPREVTVAGFPYPGVLATRLLRDTYGACMCCRSIMCPGNPWSPATRIADVLREVGRYAVLRRLAFEKLMARSVGRQRLPPGVDEAVAAFFVTRDRP